MLFVSKYPSNENMRDGMIQRIKSVDTEFFECDRIYLQISFLHYLKKVYFRPKDNIQVYKVNIFIHFYLIYKLLCANTNIYVHSIYNFTKLLLFNLAHKQLTLDVHGSVPEELMFLGKKYESRMFSFVEKKAFQMAKNIIFVSEEMKDFYQNKYPFISGRNMVLKPIYSSNVLHESDEDKKTKLRRELQIEDDDIVFVYAGRLQKWQNIDLMLTTINENKNKKYVYLLLSGDAEEMKALAGIRLDKEVRYIVRSVDPVELNTYYSISNYGFILRDENVLNRVAAPTKMIEYLYFGIIPIVKYERIGDSLRYGYKHLSYIENLSNLQQCKSLENIEIAKKMLNKNREGNLLELYQNRY